MGSEMCIRDRARAAALSEDLPFDLESVATFARGAMATQPSPHLLGEGRPFLPDVKQVLGSLPVRMGESNPKESAPAEAAPQLSLAGTPPEEKGEGPESDASDDRSLGDSSDSSASSQDAMEDWKADLDWFASKAKWHWRGTSLAVDPPGSLRCAGNVLLTASGFDKEGVGLASALALGRQPCDKCRKRLLKTHPEASEDDLP